MAKDKHKCENLETYKHRLKVMPEIVKFLIQHGANPDTLNNWGFTPIKNIYLHLYYSFKYRTGTKYGNTSS